MTALHTEAYRRFTAALVQARQRAGLSQYDLADRLGVDQSYISKVENSRRRLDVIEFLQIMQAMGVSYREVLDGLVAPARGREVSTPPPA